MVHQGSARKRRKRLNPRPKRPNAIPYRDLKHQNEWLRENLFDSKGNYLFCRSCICATFEVSPGRLARQRTIKRKQSTDPLKDMSKTEVEDQRLGDYIVMPTAVDSSFKAWWRSLQPSHIVSIRYPHARHGNAGQTAHSAKTSVMESFLQFVDVNSQPNGRSEDSTGPTFYFLPKFTTIQKPKAEISHFRERLAKSLVGEFNRAQQETGGGEISNGTSHNWLKKYRPKHAICPHKQDYCDTCATNKEDINAKQTSLNRLRQAAATPPEEIKRLEDELVALRQSLENHREEAR